MIKEHSQLSEVSVKYLQLFMWLKRTSCFGTDIDCSNIGQPLHLAHDAVKTALPDVRQGTKIRTICEDPKKTSCYQNATRRTPQTVKIVFQITYGIADFGTHIVSLRRLRTYLRSITWKRIVYTTALSGCIFISLLRTHWTLQISQGILFLQTNNAKCILKNWA